MASDTRNQQGQPSSETTRARTAWRTSGLLWYGFIISGIMSFVEELGGKTRAAMDANYNVWRELMVEDIENASCPHSTEGRQLVAAAVGALARARLDTRFV